MPEACFSYPADVSPGTGTRNAAQSDLSGLRRIRSACFSYPADVPLGPRRMPRVSSCFRYPADVPPGPRQMTGE